MTIPAVRPVARRLPAFFGASFGLAVAVGGMIGAGILRAPRDAAAQLPSVWLFVGVWIAGGIYALLGANAVAELAAMRPRSGGQYSIAQHAFGPFTAFAAGWADWLSCCGSVAALAIVFAEAATALLGKPTLVLPVAITSLAVSGLVLWQGSRSMNASQQVTSLLKFVCFVALAIGCFVWGLGNERAIDVARITPMPTAFTGFVLALQGVIFAYDGWVGIVYFGEEVQNPGRDIPRALFGGVLSVMGVYVLLNVALVMVLPLHAIAADPLPTATAASVVFGASGDTLVRILVLIALPSTILANHGFGTRVAYALGRDLPRLGALGDANSAGTPRLAVLVSTAIAIAFLATGTFERVVTLCSVIFVATYAVTFAAVFRLRATEPDTPRPFRSIGHPFSTGFVLIGSVVFLVSTAMAAPRDSAIALGLIVLSYPLYRVLNAGRASV